MPERLPDIAKRGVLIEEPNPQEAIRKAAEANREFVFRAEITKLRRWINGDPDSGLVGIKDRLYPSIQTPWFQGNLPPVGVAIEPLKKDTLASYRLVPDGYGLAHKITFNEKHFIVEEDEDGRAVHRQFFIHTYCGPAGRPGPGCNVKVTVWAKRKM